MNRATVNGESTAMMAMAVKEGRNTTSSPTDGVDPQIKRHHLKPNDMSNPSNGIQADLCR